MNPQIMTALPPWLVGLGLVVVVAAIVLVLSTVIFVLARFVGSRESDPPSLAKDAERLLRARRGFGKIDADFDRLIEGTQLGISSETAAGGILLVAAVAAVSTYLVLFDLLWAGIIGLGAGAIVFLLFWLLQNRRRRAIQEQLPDGCFQLARSLRSGLNLPMALRETAEYVSPPLSGLFLRLGSALSLGESARDATRRVADDARVTEFDLLTEIIALNAVSGGNLPAMLDRLAASIRDRNQYRGYFRTTTSLSRIAAYFLALAAPVAFLFYLILPTQRVFMLEFLEAPEGQLILAVAIFLWIVGIVWVALLLRRQDDY